MHKRPLTVLLLLALLTTVFPVANAAHAQGGGDLIFGEPIEATLSEGATDEYIFQSPGQETLSATMTTTAPGLDPVLELYGPDGALIAFSDDTQPGVLDAALVNAPLQTEGTYTLVARSFGNRGSGSYTLTATRLTVFTPVEEVLEIAIGDVVSGEIAVAGEVDRYTFQGAQGQVVSIALDRTDDSAPLDPLVELFGPDGTSLAASDDDGGNLNSLISGFTLPVDGVYTIAARSWGNQYTGPYMLSLTEGAAAPPPAAPLGVPPQQGLPSVGREGELTLGTPVIGLLAEGTMDVWTFQGESGTVASVSLMAIGGVLNALDPTVELVGPDGASLAYDDDSGGDLNSLITAARLPADGVYTVRVRAYSDRSSGMYTLLVQAVEIQVNTGNIEPGQTVEATLAPGAADEWTLVARAGQVFSIAVYAQGNAFDTTLRILDERGQELLYDDDGGPGLNSQIRGWVAPADGAYTLRVSSFSGSSGGAYLLMVAPGETFLWPESWLQGALTFGEPVAGRFTADALTHIWTFEARAGDYFQLDVSGDLYVELTDAAGNYVNYSGPGTPFRIEQGGQYFVTLNGYTPGAYTLTLSRVEAPQVNTGNIEPGQTVEATLAPGATDEWTLVAQRGQVFSFGLFTSGALRDPLLRLVDENGNEVFTGSPSYSGASVRIIGWIVPAGGPYTLQVSSYGYFGGPYTLSVQLGETVLWPAGWLQGTAPLGEPVTDRFEAEGQSLVWSFEAEAGQYFLLETTGNFGFQIENAVGDVSPIYPNPNVPFRVDQAGQYYLVLTAYQPGLFAFALSEAEPPQINTGSITPGESVEATLAPGATDEWTFSAQAGDRITAAVTARGNAFDTTLRVVDAQGNELAYNDDSGGSLNSEIRDLVLPADGEYTLHVGSYGNRSGGPYTLTLNQAEAPQVNTGNIEPGQTVEATLAPGATDEWTLVAQRGQVFSIAVYAQGNAFDTTLRILDERGQELLYDDDGGPGLNSQIRGWVAPADGAYTLRVSSFSGSSGGAYLLMVAPGETFLWPESWLQGALTFGEPVAGRFTADALTHIWTFEARAGDYFQLDASGDFYLDLTDAAGNYVEYRGFGVPFAVQQGGQYFATLNGYTPGPYTLTLSRAEAPQVNTGNIEPGQTVEATLSPTATDEWTFTGQRGDVVTIRITAQDGAFDTTLRLLNAAGQEIAYNDDSGGSLNSLIQNFTLPADGEYTIRVGSFGGYGGGPYTLTLESGAGGTATRPGGGTIVAGQVVEGDLAVGAQDEWTFTGQRGDVVTISLTAQDNAFDTVLHLLNAAGQEIAYNDDGGPGYNSLIQGFSLPADGEYTIRVRSYGDRSGGPYTLSLGAGSGIPADQFIQGEIAPGQTVDARLDYGAWHDWAFQADAGAVISVGLWAAPNTDLDTVLNVIGPDGATVATDDDGGRGYNSMLVGLRLPTAGTYRLRVGSYADQGEGAYLLALYDGATLPILPGALRGVLARDVSTTGALFGDAEHAYTFTVAATQNIAVTVSADDRNILFLSELYDPAGRPVASGSTRVPIVLRNAAPGEYTLFVYTNDYGSRYHVVWQEAPPPAAAYTEIPAGELVFDSTASGNLEMGQAAAYTLTVPPAGAVTLAAYGEKNLDPVLLLYAPDGALLAQDDNGGRRRDALLRAADLPGGDYRVVVRAAGTDQAGTYRLSVMTGEDALTPTGHVGEVAIGAPVTGTLNGPLAEDWWLFAAKAGDAVDIRLDADAALADGALIELSGPDGVLLGRSGSVLTGVYLPRDGTYRVAVYTLGIVGGDYTLAINPAAPNLPPLRQQGALTEGASVAGTLLPGQNDGYLLQGVAGQIVSLTTAAAVYGSPDIILELYDPRGQRVAYNDDAGGSLNARLDAVRLPTDGTYTVVVRSYNPAEGGAYTLTLIDRGGPAVARATVAPGQAAQGLIAIAGQRDTYALTITAPLTVSIAADTPALAFAPLISLYAPDGGYLFGGARRLDGITLDAPGTYRVVVSSGVGRGPYTLVVSAE